MATLQFKVRLGEALHAAIKRAAEENSRSVNSEIVHRLQQTFDLEEGGVPERPLKIVDLWAGPGEVIITPKDLNDKLDRLIKKLEEK